MTFGRLGAAVLFLQALFAFLFVSPSYGATRSPPNIIIILADDLGYGDLSVQGHPLIRTPNIDRLAREGQRWTSFYASAPLCGPSREALLTGRMPIRIHGTGKNEWRAIPDEELTIGELVKPQGYSTAYIGKWGVGGGQFNYKGAHPNEQGFEYFYGLIGSNDAPMPDKVERTYENVRNAKSTDFPIALYRQRSVVEMPVDQSTLTRRYTDEAVKWIGTHGKKRFMLFLAHSMPHVPIFPSSAFQGHSKAGRYGDVIEEIDWSVGQLVRALEKTGEDRNTLIIFSSDNGPWRTYYDLGGSSGPWRDGKMTGWEGAYRVPGIFWWPGTIKPATIDGIGVNVDLASTIARLTNTQLPADRKFDSVDLTATLLNGESSRRSQWLFYGPDGELWGARSGNYKLVYKSSNSLGREEQFKRGYGDREVHDPPLLFDLSVDMAERQNIAETHPEIVKNIEDVVDRYGRSLRN